MTRKAPNPLPPGAWSRIRDAYLAGESAIVICEHYAISLTALRQRARENGWRRLDVGHDEDIARSAVQIDPAQYATSLYATSLYATSLYAPDLYAPDQYAPDLAPTAVERDLGRARTDADADADADGLDDARCRRNPRHHRNDPAVDAPTGPDFDDPTVLAELALMRAKREVLAGRVISALRWTRLYRELLAIGTARTRAQANTKTSETTPDSPNTADRLIKADRPLGADTAPAERYAAPVTLDALDALETPVLACVAPSATASPAPAAGPVRAPAPPPSPLTFASEPAPCGIPPLAPPTDPRYRVPMNAIDTTSGPATLHYGDGEFAVLKPGPYVLCAVSGRVIPLEVLRYWSAERQEPYASPAEAMTRMTASADPQP